MRYQCRGLSFALLLALGTAAARTSGVTVGSENDENPSSSSSSLRSSQSTTTSTRRQEATRTETTTTKSHHNNNRRLISHDADGTGVAGRYIVVLKPQPTDNNNNISNLNTYHADGLVSRIQDVLDQLPSSSSARLDRSFHVDSSFSGFTVDDADDATLAALLARDDVDLIEQVRSIT
jgi:hypothetical protein